MPYVTKTYWSAWHERTVTKEVWTGPITVERVGDIAGKIVGYTLLFGSIAAAIWSIVYGISNYERGLYAGYFYKDAVQRLEQIMVKQVGLTQAQRMRFPEKGPNVINTHLVPQTQKGAFPSPQVRVFHIIGPEGVKWCVWIWHHNSAQNKRIVKGCRF